MHAYCERYAYEMAPVRGTPMRWPMKDARLWETRLWDGFCEKHAYERCAHEMADYEVAAYKRHDYEMAYERSMPMRCTPTTRDMPMNSPCERHIYDVAYERCTPMGDMPMG